MAEGFVISAVGPADAGGLEQLLKSIAAAGAKTGRTEQARIGADEAVAIRCVGGAWDPAALESAGRPFGGRIFAHGLVSGGQRFVATAAGDGLGSGALGEWVGAISQHAAIEGFAVLANGSRPAIEAQVSTAAPELLRAALIELGGQRSLDVGLQREGPFRREKRLIVCDMDSTLIRIEVIDELARAFGVTEKVAAITERAMRGEMDYDESLRQRLALLRGLDADVLRRLAANLPVNDGAERLFAVLKRLGYRTAVVSGGFSIAAEALKARLGLDDAYSNQLEIQNGKLTGNVVGEIVNGKRKAEHLRALAARIGIGLDQVIAVGDGANDREMIETAGLGVAFRAKPALRKAADALVFSSLDSILYLLGLSEQDVQGERRP
jgi:phosphoserine phosphatase